MIDYSKYPRTQKFLSEHPGMTLDEAIVYFETIEKTKKRGGFDTPKEKTKYDSWTHEQLLEECKRRGLL